jgi:hypothetical protein
MGRGLLATTTIPEGTRILAEAPLVCNEFSSGFCADDLGKFVTNFDFLRQPKTADREDDIAAHLTSHLTDAKLEAFKDLTNNNTTFVDSRTGAYEDAPFTGIILTNAVPLDIATGWKKYGELGVFAELSRANHACRPNAHQTWNEDLKLETLHALHNISPGEEITINYRPDSIIDPKWLEKVYGFQCFCEYCLYEGAEADRAKKRSGINCQRIDTLSCELEDAGGLREELANCWERWGLCEKEHIVDWRAGLICLDGFDVAVEMGDKGRAKRFAELAEEMVGHCEGEDSCTLRVLRERLVELCGEDALKETIGADLDEQRTDGWSAEMDLDESENESHSAERIDKGKGKESEAAGESIEVELDGQKNKEPRAKRVDKGKSKEVVGAESLGDGGQARKGGDPRAARKASTVDAGNEYRRYESELHWLFMIEKAPQEDEIA